MRLRSLLAAFAMLATPVLALAQEKVDGAAIVKEGIGDVPACEGCHEAGADEFPLLAGQAQGYLFQQLQDFRRGRRDSDIMGPFAKAMTVPQIGAVAAWYAAQPKRQAQAPDPLPTPEQLARGKTLTTDGDEDRKLFPCDRCHGPAGRGGDLLALAGQNPAYMVAQIKAFRDGTRTNDSVEMMQGIAKKLTDDDAMAAAAYYWTMPKP